MPITQDQYDEDIARLVENMRNAEARAADWRAQGREDRAQTWDASADRYSRLIDIKKKLFESSQRVQAIRDRVGTPIVPEPSPSPSPSPSPNSGPRKEPPPGTENAGNTDRSPIVPNTPPPVNPTPVQPPSPPPPPPPPPVKTAPIDTVLFNDDSIDANIIIDLLFENVGGQEILSIARYDTVNGQQVSYQPFANLNIIQQQFNPNNILSLQKTSDKTFANFSIKLDDKIPFVGNGPDGENVYLNDLGGITIDLVNLAADEQIEIQIIQDGTIYEVGI